MKQISEDNIKLWKKIVDEGVKSKGGFNHFKQLDMEDSEEGLEDEDSAYQDEVWKLFETCLDKFNRETPQESKFKDYRYHLENSLYTYVTNMMWGKEVDMIEVYKDILLGDDSKSEDNYLGDGKWKITPEELDRKTPLTKEDIATYYELLDSIFKKKNWDKVLTEKEVEEKYEYSKDLMTMNEWRVSQKDNFENQLRFRYNEYVRERASVYELTPQHKRQFHFVTSFTNNEKDIYVEVRETYRYMKFCMTVGYEFAKNSIRKGELKVDIHGLRLTTWVNIRGKVVVESVDLDGEFDASVEVFDKKGYFSEDELEEIEYEFTTRYHDMEEEGWKMIGSRIDIYGDDSVNVEVKKLKDIEY